MLEYLITVGLGMLGGVAIYAPLARKVWNLQCDIASTQAQLLKDRNQRAAMIRHKDKESLELLNDLKGTPKPVVPPNPMDKFRIVNNNRP